MNAISPRVSNEQNTELLFPFTEDEIQEALFTMHPDKSPGPDGMNPTFFQQFWRIIGKDVTRFCLNFLNNCSFSPKLNETNIVLIPKKVNPELVTDLRPISLCNVIYKIISKVLANHLKKILPTINSDSQSAFVKDLQITDNTVGALGPGPTTMAGQTDPRVSKGKGPGTS